MCVQIFYIQLFSLQFISKYYLSSLSNFISSFTKVTFFSRIIESRQSCELNPNKIESATEACANAEFLLQVLDDITESIFMSSEACPRTLRLVFL